MEGESLFNDGTSIVLFTVILYLALHPDEGVSTADAVVQFCIVFFGGLFFGLFKQSRIVAGSRHAGLVNQPYFLFRLVALILMKQKTVNGLRRDPSPLLQFIGKTSQVSLKDIWQFKPTK